MKRAAACEPPQPELAACFCSGQQVFVKSAQIGSTRLDTSAGMYKARADERCPLGCIRVYFATPKSRTVFPWIQTGVSHPLPHIADPWAANSNSAKVMHAMISAQARDAAQQPDSGRNCASAADCTQRLLRSFFMPAGEISGCGNVSPHHGRKSLPKGPMA